MSNENKHVGGEVDELRKNALMEEGANHYKAKRYEEALEAYERATRLDPDNAVAYAGKGDSLRKLKKYEDALEIYEKAIEFDPNNASAYNGKGQTLRRQQRYEEALKTYDKAIKLDPERAQLYYNKGNVYFELKEYDQALLQYRHAIRLHSKLVKAYLQEARTLCKLGKYEKAFLSYECVLQKYPHISWVHREEAGVLYCLKRYEEALNAYERALQLDPQLVAAHVGKGHTLFELKYYGEALQAYRAAIALGVANEDLYYNMGDLLATLLHYEEALQAYERVLQLDPSIVQAYISKGNVIFHLKRYKEALATFKQAIRLDKKNITAYLRMGDIQTILNQQEYAIDAYEIALGLVEDELNPDTLWSFAYTSQTPYRPAQIQFELFEHFLIHAPSDSHTNLAFECIGNLYERLFDENSVPPDTFSANMEALRNLLIRLPEEKRAEALTLMANGDDIRIALLLIHLAPFSLSGLSSLAHQITLRWVPAPRNDNLVIRFYHVLDSYGVPFEDSDWLFAQELIVEGLYIQVKSVLSDLVKQQPTPDRLWLLATAMRHRKDPVQHQIEVLYQFNASTAPSDARCGEAWKRIGELAAENGDDGIAAIEALKKAEYYGLPTPQLQAFRAGDWDAIPALRTHPDYPFPPVVAIDLESDYQPDAPPGSCVFEVGAVCVKGGTELDAYHAIIRHDRVSPKIAHKQSEAKSLEQVVRELQAFIEKSQGSIEHAVIVGHNLQAFDAPHLRAMGILINDDQIIDTLTFARLLYPDSLHHRLELLRSVHKIPSQGQAHTALPDARTCALLLHKLGDELVQRGERLLAGFRAFVPPGSVFDRVVLQPRNVAADPAYAWELDPTPTAPHVLVSIDDIPPSSHILEAMSKEKDTLIERYDPNAAYAQHLLDSRKSVVTVGTRTRLERMLFLARERSDLFVLPDPRTLLCPHRLRQHIKQAENYQMKLTLFCLYQASHNHDAHTLYPLRIPSDETPLTELKQMLTASCCESDWYHSDSCPAILAAKKAADTSNLLLATHESFLHQKYQPEGDVIIVDDADELQMHFAEYLAERVTGEQLFNWSVDVCKLLEAQISKCVNEHISTPGFHERLPLHSIVPYLTQPQDGCDKSLLTLLKEVDPIGETIASKLEGFRQASLQEAIAPGQVHAYWLDLQISHKQEDSSIALEQWSFCGLNRDLRQAFEEAIWQPYKQHIICGTAITLGASETTFLKRFFGLPDDIAFLADERPPTQVYIPIADIVRPSSFLGRRSWAESAGAFLYRLALSSRESFVVTLHPAMIADALADAFKLHEEQVGHQILSPHLGWTTTKIADRLAMDERSAMAIISPYLRRAVLDSPVDIEVTGPLRFLNQRDPLVGAQMRAFAELYKSESHFTEYLLPQALLELKARVSSQARIHVILDSALREAIYRDEVFSLFKDGEVLDTLPGTGTSQGVQDIPDSFSVALAAELERQGLSVRANVSDEDLYLTLQAIWGMHMTFRESPLNQKEVVHSVLEGKDQLVIAATGGGKSLCFQLPAILLAQDVVPKVTLVISPLIALMRDQIAVLQRRGVFSAVAWDSMLSSVERESYLRGIKQGDYSIIYIAPEQIHSSALRRALAKREVGLIAIDEAHCVSQWGHDFRTAYFALKKWINEQICVNRKRSPLLAVTATARKGYARPDEGYVEKATVEDIIEKLGLRLNSGDVKMSSPERPELEFRVERIELFCPNCHRSLGMRVGEVKCEACHKWCSISKEDIRQAKLDTLIRLLSEPGQTGLRHRWEGPYGARQRGIVYCRTVNETRDVAQDLIIHIPGLRVGIYHGGERITKEERQRVYQRFMSDGEDGLDIIVATNAFGMGIDARRLGFIIHFDIPATLEAYYQESGRAGRDSEFQQGKDRAQCILLYHESDLEAQLWLTSRNRVTEQDLEVVYEALCKLRSPGEQELLVTERDITLLTGIDKEKDKDKIATSLFYLEYHTQANGSSVLERRENAVNLWQLKFEQGYQQRIVDPAIHSRSRQLIEAFCLSAEFRLREDRTAIIDANNLATYLGWKMFTLEAEVKNLVKRHIIVYASPTYVNWTRSRSDSYEIIKQVVKDVRNVLNNVEDRDAFLSGRVARVNILSLYDKGELNALSLQVLIHFLSQLEHADADDLRLFTFFYKATDPFQQGYYRLRLKPELQPQPAEKVREILRDIDTQLCQAAEQFGHDTVADEYQYIDLLREAPDYAERQRLKRSLRWLSILGLLEFPEESKRDIAMRVSLKQDTVSPDNLKIDLTSLRLVERYGEKKLARMREYATLSAAQRSQFLYAYFFGESPLIEPFEMRSDLTNEQKALVIVPGGYHLIQGPAGSGKTTILQEHFRYLVEHLLVPVDRILVTAHFNSAIGRMADNLEHSQRSDKVIRAKTLNSLGERIFRQYRHLLKRIDGQPYYAEDMEVKLEKEEINLISSALERLSREKWIQELLPADLESPHIPETYKRDASKEKRCRDAISLLRSQGIFPACVSSSGEIRTALKRISIEKVSFLLNNLQYYYAVYIAYQLVQGDRGLYTYDDQILFALTILKANPEIAKQLQRDYEHIIVDEFQDLTPAEGEFIAMLSHKHKNVLAVGDFRQQIRPGQIGFIALYETFELLGDGNPVQEHHLTINFRSVQEILDFANAVLQQDKSSSQIAACGSKGVKPCIIRVSTHASLSPHDDDIDDGLLYAMVDAALYQLDLLPPFDAGSVALMVARRKWSHRVQTYLRNRGRPFSVLDNTHRYQSYHVKLVLTYFRLIHDKDQDEEVGRLLRCCVVPYFDASQIRILKEIAKKHEHALLDIVLDQEILKRVNATDEQIAALQRNVAVLQRHYSGSAFKDVWQSISELQDGPIPLASDHEQEAEELESVFDELKEMSVKQALEYINSHISFLEEHHTDRNLVVTTIDYAKSQDFDTVFLLGAGSLKDRRRWYVSVTRAKQRFFCLVDARPPEDQKSYDILSSISKELYDTLSWSRGI